VPGLSIDLRKQADMKTVLLRGEKAAGRVALVDDGDYDLVLPYKWHVEEFERPGCWPSGPYAAALTKVDGRWVGLRMHKFLTGWPRTDHIDHNGLNNQRSNLRPATNGQNGQNSRKRPGRTSAYKGVWWSKQCRKWQVGIRVDGKTLHLGLYLDEIDAALAYDIAAQKYFGEYACPNFPTPADVPIGQLSWDFG
jgi:hypothetical protein